MGIEIPVPAKPEGVDAEVWTVSYTHLDVYKRQVPNRREAAPESPLRRDQQNGADDQQQHVRQLQEALLADALSKLAADHRGQHDERDAACLLYTSRCV